MKKSIVFAFVLGTASLSFAAVPATQEAVIQNANQAANAFFNRTGFAPVYRDMPAKYQKNASEFVKTLSTVAGRDLWESFRDAMTKVCATVVKQNQYVATELAPEDDPEKANMANGLFVNGGATLAGMFKAATFENAQAGNAAAIFGAAPLSMKGYTDAVKPFEIPAFTVTKNEEDFRLDTTICKMPITWEYDKKADGYVAEFLEEIFDDIPEITRELKKLSLSAAQRNALITLFKTVGNTAVEAGKATTKEAFDDAITKSGPIFMMQFAALNALFSKNEGLLDAID